MSAKSKPYLLFQLPTGTSREAGRPSYQIREALLGRGESEGAAVAHPEGEEVWHGRLKSVVAPDEVDSLNRSSAKQVTKIKFRLDIYLSI